MILRIGSDNIVTLKMESTRVFPLEACAILFGEVSQNESIIKKIYIASNRLKSEILFEIDPEEALEAMLEAEEEGLELVGFFHSHKLHTKPSSIDEKYMKLWGNALWLIYSNSEDSFSAYQLQKGKLLETNIIID
jgi:proteasome lid subunit RPN8/RPN11